MEGLTFKISLWCFFAAMMAHFFGLSSKDESKGNRLYTKLGLSATAIGFLSLTVMIIHRWVEQSRVPISSSFEYLSVLSWFVAFFYFVVYAKVKKSILVTFISPVLFLAMVFAGMYPRKLEMTLVPALQSYWLKIHVSMTIIGEAAFAVAFVAGLLYLIRSYEPEKVSSSQKRGNLFLFLLSLIVGIGLIVILKSSGLLLVGLTGPVLLVGLVGAALLPGLVVYLAGYGRLFSSSGPGNHGSFVFAMAVLSLLISGIILGSYTNRNESNIEATIDRIEAVDALVADMMPMSQQLDGATFDKLMEMKKDRLEAFLGIERLHSQQKHSLTRDEVAPLLKGTGIADELSFPLTLGEIREQRRRVQATISNWNAIRQENTLPMDANALQLMRQRMVEHYRSLVTSGILPHDKGRVSVFLGLMILFALPVFIIVYSLAPKLKSRIPELDTLDSLTYRTVMVGWSIFTIGALIAGAIWAHYAWGKWWSNDPKEIGSLIVWLVYTIYLHARYVRMWKGNQAAAAAILGFLFAVLSFVGNSVLGGLHSYG